MVTETETVDLQRNDIVRGRLGWIGHITSRPVHGQIRVTWDSPSYAIETVAVADLTLVRRRTRDEIPCDELGI